MSTQNDPVDNVVLAVPCPRVECAAEIGVECTGAVDPMGRRIPFHYARYQFAVIERERSATHPTAARFVDELLDGLRSVLPPETPRTVAGIVSAVQHWKDIAGAAIDAVNSRPAPIPMRLPCPVCGKLHIDVAFATKPHHTHACQECGCVWRPAVVHTVGVRFLPGFKDDASAK